MNTTTEPLEEIEKMEVGDDVDLRRGRAEIPGLADRHHCGVLPRAKAYRPRRSETPAEPGGGGGT